MKTTKFLLPLTGLRELGNWNFRSQVLILLSTDFFFLKEKNSN